jgi:hypothetical protein
MDGRMMNALYQAFNRAHLSVEPGRSRNASQLNVVATAM